MAFVQRLPILLISALFLSPAARAGAITGSGFGEIPAGFVSFVSHGPILANGQHALVPAGGSNFWNLLILIVERDGGGLVEDQIGIEIDSRHKVGVPGHPGEGANPNGVVLQLFTATEMPYVAGANMNIALDEDEIDHPPLNNHTDHFGATLKWTVAANLKDIVSYRLDVFGAHCDACPALPSIDRPLQSTPEPGTGLMVLIGAAAVGFFGRRRKIRPPFVVLSSTHQELVTGHMSHSVRHTCN